MSAYILNGTPVTHPRFGIGDGFPVSNRKNKLLGERHKTCPDWNILNTFWNILHAFCQKSPQAVDAQRLRKGAPFRIWLNRPGLNQTRKQAGFVNQ